MSLAERAVLPRRSRPRLWIALIGLLVFSVAVAWWRGDADKRSIPEARQPIAVIAFENLVDPPDSSRLGPITSHLLIASLAQASEVPVLSALRVLDATRRTAAAPAGSRGLRVARRLGAARVVTGRIVRTVPALVIGAELIEVPSGRVLDAMRVEGRPGQTLFGLVDALSARIVRRIHSPRHRVRLGPVAERSSTDLEAQREYSLGLEDLARDDVSAALGSFRGAVTHDPAFAEAYYALAISQWRNGALEDASESLNHAQGMEDRLPPFEREMIDGLVALAAWDLSKARDLFERMRTEYPDEKLVTAGLLETCSRLGDWPLAIEAGRRTLALDPDFEHAVAPLVDALGEAGRYDEAEALARRALRRDPGDGALRIALFRTLTRRGEATGALGIARGEGSRESSAPFLSTASALLRIGLDSLAAVQGAMPTDSLPAWRTRDMHWGIEYHLDLHRGRFRDALRVASRAWRQMPVSTRGEVAPIPIADGTEAAVVGRDVLLGRTWSDSLTVRQVRWAGSSSTIRAGLERWYTRFQLGDSAWCSKELDRLQALPEFRSEAHGRFVRFARAIELSARGQHRDALEQLDQGQWFGSPSLAISMPALMRIQFLTGAGLYAEALGALDTLMSAPVLPGDESARLRLYRGRLLERLGRAAEAASAYRGFLTLWRTADPGLPELTEARGALRRLRGLSPTPRRAG